MSESIIISMEESSEQTEQPMQASYTPDPKLLTCLLCQQTLQRPTTLACGHTFCHRCLITAICRKF